MPRFAQEQLNEQFKRLPPALKDALFSAEVADKILTIGRKYELNIEKTGFLAEETGYIILGFSRADEFVRMLAERIHITRAQASEIAKEINREILTPIREELRRAHALQITDVDLEKAGEILPHKHPNEIAHPQPVPQRPPPARPPSIAVPKNSQLSRPPTPPQKPSAPLAATPDLIGQFPKPPPARLEASGQAPPLKSAAPPFQATIQPPIPAPIVAETKQIPRMAPKIPPIDLRGSKPPITPLQTPTPPREAAFVPKPPTRSPTGRVSGPSSTSSPQGGQAPPIAKDRLANDPYREPME